MPADNPAAYQQQPVYVRQVQQGYLVYVPVSEEEAQAAAQQGVADVQVIDGIPHVGQPVSKQQFAITLEQNPGLSDMLVDLDALAAQQADPAAVQEDERSYLERVGATGIGAVAGGLAGAGLGALVGGPLGGAAGAVTGARIGNVAGFIGGGIAGHQKIGR